MDRNTLTGFALLAVLVIAYFGYNSYNKSQQEKYNQHIQDSIARVHPPVPDSLKVAVTPQPPAAQQLSDSQLAALPPAYRGTAQTIRLENKNLRLDFNTKGATPVAALLKDFKTYEGQPLYLFNGEANKLVIDRLPGLPGGAPQASDDLYFTPTQQGPAQASFVADMGNGQRLQLDYSLPAEGYMLECRVQATGIPGGSLPMRWQMTSRHTEHDLSNERLNSQIYYQYKNGDHDYYTIRESNKDKTMGDGNLEWLGFRMHFFSTALINKDGAGLGQTSVTSSTELPDSSLVASQTTSFALPLKADGTANLQWYIGPNDYKILKSYHIGLDEMVPLGYGLFFFVKYINKWLIIPVFHLLHDTMGIVNMGIVIMLLTIFIRLILSFFTYKSYLSAAKMRVLKPELDELRAKYGDDQQRMGMEQMKLYRSAGVNPLGGCLPTLFQIPILFAMYYFFPSSIDLRQKSFLWADDLSTYDSIWNFGFNIPFYGDHVSLFTILMTLSSLWLALYNRNMTAGQGMDNPMLKYMPYIFPVMLLGVFNKMAAALTFYYFFSNLISIAQQFIIQKYVIDEKKIHAQLQENRNKPATPSKWAQRMEEMQKAQAEKMKNRSSARKH